MKGMAVLLMLVVVFVLGALYGIDKNNEKRAYEPAVVTVQPDPVKRETADLKKEEGQEIEDVSCIPPYPKENIPWISKLAGGLGEGVAMSFNGVIVFLAEIIQAG